MKKKLHKVISVLLILALLAGLTMPAMAADHPFNDVPDDQWYAGAVQFVYENNIMGGVGNNQFNPQGSLTRAAVTALLFRVHYGRTANAQDDRDNNFNDVGNAWYAPYVTWAFNNDIVFGTSATTFDPNGNITRQEFAVMVYRYAMNMTDLQDSTAASAQWSQFTDRGQIAAWAYSALRWINNRGVMTGLTTTTINPTGTATRAEAAVIMMRFVEVLLLDPFLFCPGCGDRRTYFLPGDDANVENNAVSIVFTRCVSQRDNRDWTLEDFGNIEGALYIRDVLRLSDREWELIQAGRWQETFRNWPMFRRGVLIRLDQNCRENVRRVIEQLHQQHDFIYWAGPVFISVPV